MSPNHPIEPENPIDDAIDAAEDIHDPLDGLAEKTAPIRARPLALRRWKDSPR